MRKFGIAAALSASALVAVAVLLVGVAPQFSGAADHLEAPFVQTDGRIDINDVYAFTNGSNTVLALTVNPLAGVVSTTTFRSDALYQFKIDNDGDAEAEIAYRIEFSAPDSNGKQELTLSRVTGVDAENDTGTGVQIAKGKTAGSDDSRRVNPIPGGGGKLYAGLRDDPFFFDFVSFGTLTFCTTVPAPDFFAGLNVSAIVLEVPTSDLLGATSDIGVWATTNLAGAQVERMGRPVINTALIPSGSKDAFNATVPADDVATWTADVTASLIGLNGDAGYSAAVAAILLPDILTIDTSAPSGFLNGRTLDDDVGDTVLDVVSMGAITTDCVDANDAPFLSTFPYLADTN